MDMQGMYYFLAHPFLWPLARGRLLPCFLLSFAVYGTLFFWCVHSLPRTRTASNG
jgi:hypothetical protein